MIEGRSRIEGVVVATRDTQKSIQWEGRNKLLRNVGAMALAVLGYFGMTAAGAQNERAEAQSQSAEAQSEPSNAHGEGPTQNDAPAPSVSSDTASAPQAAPAAAANEGAVQLEEVIVTARKTQESLQRVPESITAISGNDLAKRSINDLSSVSRSTPNFSFAGSGRNGRSAGIVYIRGVGQSFVGLNFDPAVGVYLDGVILGGQEGNDVNMLDIERVEILRGPQGTLFGRNTSGGAVSITTRKPDASTDGPTGWFQVTGGSRNRFDANGSVNIPLVTDQLALLVAGGRRTQDGYGDRLDGDDLGNIDRDVGRASLFWTPTPNLSALLSIDATTYDETNAVQKLVYISPSAPAVAAVNATSSDQDQYDNRWLSPSDFFSFGTGPNSSRGNTSGTSLTLNFDTGWANLKSISAYRRFHVHSDFDPDGSPIVLLDYYTESRHRQVSQEVQATGKNFDDRLSWVFGLYYFDQTQSSPPEGNAAILIPGVVPDCGACFSGYSQQVTESYAAYGQANYNLTEKLRATVGLRLTRDSKDFIHYSYAYPSFAVTSSVGPLSQSWQDVSPRLGLDYQWTPDVMTYVSMARGYKGGGFNGGQPVIGDNQRYEPEHVLNYEIGLRSDLLDRRLRFNATAFYNDYTDFQMQIAGSTTNSDGNPVGFTVTSNVPKSRITGAELELTAVLTKELKLTSGLGLTYPKYTELPADEKFIAANLVNKDSQFPYTPKLSYTLGAEYATAITSTLDAIGRVDYAYKSTTYYDLFNSTYLRQSPYGLLNLHLTFDYRPKDISLSLFATNLTDKHYFTGGYDDATTPNTGIGIAYVNMASPREFGATVQIRF
jgi:iron complex outermembrane receptor protein